MHIKNKFVGTLIFTLFISGVLYSQHDRNILDEIPPTPQMYSRVMQMSNPTELQFDTIWAVTQNYNKINMDTMLKLAEHAVSITQKTKTRTHYGKALFLKGKTLMENKIDWDGGLSLINQSIEILKSEKQTATLNIIESRLGSCFMSVNQLEEGLKHYLKSLDWAKVTKDSALLLIEPMIGVGAIYYKLGSFEKASEMMGEAIKTMEATKFDLNLGAAYANQARILRKNGLKYEAMAELQGNDPVIYRDSAQMNFQKGLENASKGLEFAKKKQNPSEMVAMTLTVADLKNNLGDYKTALRMVKEIQPMVKKVAWPQFLANYHLTLSQSQRNLGLIAEAEQNAEAGYDIVKKNKGAGDMGIYEEELYKVYKANGKTQLALEMLEIIQKRQKQKQGESVQKAIADAETKYKTAEKEKEILELAIANEKISKQRNYTIMGGLLLGIFGFWGYRFNKVKKDRNDKMAFAEALIFAQEEERKRIGRDLHDGIGQTLLLIKKQMDNNIGATLENKQMISDTLNEVRSISQDLHPFQLDKFGLTATINDMVLKIEQSTDLFITREIDDIDGMLDQKSEIHLYRTIQEALSNIIKHAGASAAKISMHNKADKILVSILDNGKGFDLELAVLTSKSLGIRTMHERISAIGGKLKIEKGETSGTQVNIILPKSKNKS
jgi:signal transduction histidine kinase